MRSFRYLWISTKKSLLGLGFNCPSCGGKAGELLDRKYWVTSFRRCAACGLSFRTPTTTEQENASFYQSEYEEGVTTDLPDPEQLEKLKASNFNGLSTSYAHYIEVLMALGGKSGQRLMDYGSSWGYGSYQLMQAGFDVESFEISRPRAEYARQNLGIKMREVEDLEEAAFDVFFSSHVIEHVPCVEEMFRLAERVLKPGGLFIAFTPNGSASSRQRDPWGWHRNWGCVHPQLLDDVFLRRQHPQRAFVAASNPYPLNEFLKWDGSSQIHSVDGNELVLAFRKPLK